MNNIEKIKPSGIFTNYIYKAIPLAFDESMSYYETLCGVLSLLKTQEEVVNNNADALIELQQYVDHYFDNLDVQSEINNKLDEMAQNGELTELISAYLNLKSLLCFDTIEDLKTATNVVNGSFAKTFGFHSINDGGSSIYKIRTITNQDVIDNMTIIPINHDNLIAEFIKTSPTIDPRQFGAFGDGINDDYQAIQKAINISDVKMSKGTYRISNAINIGTNKVIDGTNCYLLPDSGKYAITIEGNGVNNAKQEIYIKNFNISLNNGGNGINLKDTYFIYIDNVNIANMNHDNLIGFNIENGFNHTISNCRVNGNAGKTGQIGMNIYSTNRGDGIENMTNNKYDTLLLQNLDYAVKGNFITTANMIEFNNMGFSNNKYCFYMTGYVKPLKISNTRMEGGRNSSIELVGFYFGNEVQVTIDTLNVYNINSVIESLSEYGINIMGSITLSGTNQPTKYLFIKSAKSNIEIFGTMHTQSDTYYLTNSSSFADVNACLMTRNLSIGGTNSGNSLNIDNGSETIREMTGTELLNTYGQKGSRCKIWTKKSNYNVYGSANSQTHKWSDNIILKPYHLYTIYMIDNNQAIIED